MSHIRAILFDMDGTLVNSIQAVENAWRAWAVQRGLGEEHVVHIAHGRPARDSIKLLAPEADQEREAAWVLDRELNEHGVVPIPGAAEFLQGLGDFPWGIVTSANRSLAEFRLGLAKLPIPDIFITVEDVQRGKPDPQGYLLGAQRLGIDPQHCLVVEDTPAGLQAGKSAGMRCLGITTTFKPEQLQADGLISDYQGLSIIRKNAELELRSH